MKTTLGLLRHGQTDWNIEFRLQGITDVPLNATGLAQAHAAAGRINGSDWDALLASPLSRALDTARIVHRVSGIAVDGVLVDEILLERSFGEAEGELYADWKAKHTGDPLGAESREALTARVQSFLASVASTYRGQRVLAVSHGAFIREVLDVVSLGALPPAGERISNACLNVFECDAEGNWSVTSYAPQPLA